MIGNRVSNERLERTFTKESEVPDEVMLMPVYFDAASPLDSICVGDILRELARLRPVVEAAKEWDDANEIYVAHQSPAHLVARLHAEQALHKALAALGGSDA